MARERPLRACAALLAMCGASSLSGCGRLPWLSAGLFPATDPRQCLIRAMYFESIRSSEAGLLAVGTVVMNRVASPAFPNTICGVVGQPRQFAPGALTKPMNVRDLPLIERVADQILAGRRSAGVGKAMYFHTAGYTFPYRNMHYVLVAGGNAFYEKLRTPRAPPPVALLQANSKPQTLDDLIRLAQAQTTTPKLDNRANSPLK